MSHRRPLTASEREQRAKRIIAQVECPTCGASRGSGCLTMSGLRRTVHTKRIDAWHTMRRGYTPPRALVKVRPAATLRIITRDGEIIEKDPQIMRGSRTVLQTLGTPAETSQERWISGV
jgi:hypothetical protein